MTCGLCSTWIGGLEALAADSLLKYYDHESARYRTPVITEMYGFYLHRDMPG